MFETQVHQSMNTPQTLPRTMFPLKNDLAQKIFWKKNTPFKNKQILVGRFNPSQKYAQVTLDHFVMDRGESSKNVWNYHPDFHAKPHDPQKFGETEVTKSRRPVSQGTWHKQLHYSWEVNASDLFLNVFWSRCFLGGQNFSLKLLKLKF